MKEMDYVVMGGGGNWTISARSARAKLRTPEPANFPDNASALAFVKAGISEGYRFSGRELVDRDYKLVKYRYFVQDSNGILHSAGQDWGPPDPVFEKGDIYPGGPRNGKNAVVERVVTGDFAEKAAGAGVMVVLTEHPVDLNAN
jgi:hypothetical protein